MSEPGSADSPEAMVDALIVALRGVFTSLTPDDIDWMVGDNATPAVREALKERLRDRT